MAPLPVQSALAGLTPAQQAEIQPVLDALNQSIRQSRELRSMIQLYHNLVTSELSNDYQNQTGLPWLQSFNNILTEDLQSGIDASAGLAHQMEERSTVPDLPDSVNEQTFVKANLDNNMRVDDYTCPLSGELMTDPVYFRDIQNQQRFERAWILQHLTTNNTHPISRESITLEQLVSDEELKKEIPEYIANMIQAKALQSEIDKQRPRFS